MKDSFRTKRLEYLAKHMRKSLPENICSAPFTQMFLYPTGDVFACCEGIGHLGNLKENTLEELWNGPVIQNLREEFLSGKPKTCAKNIACKGCHKNYDEQLSLADFTVEQEKPPQALEVILNGKCNIDCVMCEVKTQVASAPKIPGFKTEILEKVLPYIKQLSVKSGEPLVQKETFDLIKIMSEVNPDCVWRFTTNGQYNFNDTLKKYLDKIKIDRMTFSVDSIDPQIFAEIRKDGSLEKLMNSLDSMQVWEKTKSQDFDIDFAVNITVQKKNWKSVPDTYKFFADRGEEAYLIFVEKPSEFSLLTLERKELLEVLQFYIQLPSSYDKYFRSFYDVLKPVFESSDIIISKFKLLFEKRAIEIQHKYNQMCTLPFSQISIYPDGTLKPCCWLYNYDVREGKAGDFKSSWNGKAMRQLRQEFLTDNVKICKPKIEKLACNTKHTKFSGLVKYDEIQRGPIPVLHWYFNGKCNLQCQTCYNWQITDEFPDSDVYWESLKESVLPYVCEVEVVGGEPFYQQRTYKLISTTSEINKNCVWTITSNGQFNFKGKIEDHLRMIRLVHFCISIDSLVPEKFSKIRINGILQKTLKFLDDLIAYKNSLPIGQRFDITINFVLQKDNWTELEDMLLFAQEKRTNLYIIPMIEPVQHSIYNLPTEEKIKISRYLKSLTEKYTHQNIYDLSMNFTKTIPPQRLLEKTRDIETS